MPPPTLTDSVQRVKMAWKVGILVAVMVVVITVIACVLAFSQGDDSAVTAAEASRQPAGKPAGANAGQVAGRIAEYVPGCGESTATAVAAVIDLFQAVGFVSALWRIPDELPEGTTCHVGVCYQFELNEGCQEDVAAFYAINPEEQAAGDYDHGIVTADPRDDDDYKYHTIDVTVPDPSGGEVYERCKAYASYSADDLVLGLCVDITMGRAYAACFGSLTPGRICYNEANLFPSEAQNPDQGYDQVALDRLLEDAATRRLPSDDEPDCEYCSEAALKEAHECRRACSECIDREMAECRGEDTGFYEAQEALACGEEVGNTCAEACDC